MAALEVVEEGDQRVLALDDLPRVGQVEGVVELRLEVLLDVRGDLRVQRVREKLKLLVGEQPDVPAVMAEVMLLCTAAFSGFSLPVGQGIGTQILEKVRFVGARIIS